MLATLFSIPPEPLAKQVHKGMCMMKPTWMRMSCGRSARRSKRTAVSLPAIKRAGRRQGATWFAVQARCPNGQSPGADSSGAC